MTIFNSKGLVNSLFIFICIVFSHFSYANECSPTYGSIVTRDEVNLLNSSQSSQNSSLVTFLNSDPGNSSSNTYPRWTKTLTDVYFVICRQDNTLISKTPISLTAPNKHKLNVTSRMFNKVAGSYKFNFTVKHRTARFPDGGSRPEYYYSTFHSVGTINLIANTTPTLTITPSNPSVKYDETVNVTVTAEDKGGELKGDIYLRIDGYFPPVRSTKTGCSTKTPTKQVCNYRLTPNAWVEFKAYGFSASISNTAGNRASTTGNLTVTEDNVAPVFASASDSKIVIVPGGVVTLNATASDANINPSNGISAIKWCSSTKDSSTKDSTSSCTQIIKHNTNANDSCSITADKKAATCNYTHTFNSAGVYTVWAEVSDGALSNKSTPFSVTVDAKPVVTLTLSDANEFKLNNTVSISATATDTSLSSIKLCYGPINFSKDSCSNEIKTCTSTPCSGQLTLDTSRFTTKGYDFYAIASDGLSTVSQSLTRNVLGTFTVGQPKINGGISDKCMEGFLPKDTVKLSGTYNKLGSDNSSVDKVELWVNETFEEAITLASSSFSFNFTLGNVAEYSFHFVLTDSNKPVVWSPSTCITVDVSAPSVSPKVSYLGSGNNSNGQIKLSLTPVANATEYKWYEYDSCPQSSQAGRLKSTTLGNNRNLTLNKTYADNGNYCYCAQAANVNGDGPIGYGNSCTAVTVAIPDEAPGQTRFSASLSLTQTQLYTLSWQNDNPGARTFILESKQGQPGSSNNWQTLPLVSNADKTFNLVNMLPGDVSYRITACNANNLCLPGQIITINHQVPYLHNATYIAAVANKPAEVVFEGLGMQGLTEANIQIRNSGETFTYPVYQASGDGTTRFRLLPDEQLILGVENGGLRLQVNTPLGISTIEFNDAGSSNRANIDLINASPTVSAQGIVYVSSGQSVHALHNGNNLNGWPFTLPAETPDEVKIKAAPTLDIDVNSNDVVYVGATNRYVYKIDYQTNILWQTRIRGEIHAKAQLLAEPNPYQHNEIAKILYVGTVANGGNDVSGLYALNADTGAERFMYPLLAGVKQQPLIFANGDMHVTTEDDQLHIINRQNVGPNALRWQDIDSSLIRTNLDELVDWQIPENANVPLKSFAGLFYGLLGRSPSRAELTFFAYAYWSGLSTNEITAAFLGSDKGLARFAPTQTPAAFVDSLFTYLFPSEPSKVSAGDLTRAQWTSQLLAGVPRSEVAYNLIQTDDYFAYSANVVALITRVFYDHCNCNENADSDRDGVTDILEIELGFDPLDPTDLLIDEPSLTASEPLLGDFDLSWQVIDSPRVEMPISYRITQSINGQPTSVILSNQHEIEHNLIKASGNYQYKVQACIHAQICSQWSNEVTVAIGDSIVEAPVQPEAAPETVAEFSAPSADQITKSASFGVTAGQFRVNESGAATYSLPFNLPMGIAGVKPELGLAYSSQSGDGLAGVGWNLQGLSAISRCGANKLLDGYNKPIAFDETDNFCLNGQRLLLASGVKGEADSTYVTQVDNQQVITFNGDDSFTLEGKDKSLVTYGATENSKQTLKVNEATVTSTWLITHSQDNLRQESNQINYLYEDIADGENKVISEINYSGNKLIFNYSHNGRTKQSGYIKGNRQSQESYLTRVDIYSHQGTLLKKYQFSQVTNSIGQRELTAIRECSSDTCKKAVRFDYRSVFTQDDNDMSWRETITTTEGEYLRHAMVIDTNNDGISELVTLTQTRQEGAKLCIGTYSAPEDSCTFFTINKDLQHNIRLVPTDPDGDGFINFLVNTENSQTDGEWRQINVLSDGSLSYALTPSLMGDLSMSNNIKPMDFNGDGYNDLVETNQADNANDGTIFVRLWSNTEQSYLAPVKVKLANGLVLKPKISAGWQSIDVNQDGLSDILVWDENEENLYFFTIDPNVSTSTDPVCENRTGGERCKSTYYSAKLYDTIEVEGKHATPIDFNSDGLTDIVVYNTDTDLWQYHLNTGDGYARGTDFVDNANLSSSIAPMVVDLDGDSRLELVFNDTTDNKWYRYEWTHNEVIDSSLQNANSSAPLVLTGGFTRVAQAISDWTFRPPTDDPEDASFDHTKVEYGIFADVDNDGLLDFLYKGGIKNHAQQSLALYEGGNRVQFPGLLKSVTTGTGLTTHIEYNAMNDPSIYTPAEGLPTGMLQQDTSFRVLNIAGASALVASVTNDVPVQNAIESLSVEYHYQGARAQFARGNLGFESISTTTHKDNIPFITTTTYSQVFPFIGMPLKTLQEAGDAGANTVMSIAENRYVSQPIDLEYGYTGYQIYQQESRDCKASINTIVGSTITASGYICQQQLTVQDEFANVINSQTGHYDVTEPLVFVSMADNFSETLKADSLKIMASDNVYGDTDETKRFGRLSLATVTHTRGELSETRTSEFSYNENGMLKQEIIEPNGHCNIKLITDHTYDSAGNRTHTTAHNDASCETQVTQSKTIEYDSENRYAVKTSENGIVTSEVISRNSLGQATKVLNPDGVESTLVFDSFGSEVARYSPSGAQVTKLNDDCDDALAQCYSMKITTANGVTLAKEYVNIGGQVYAKSSRDVFGNWHSKSQVYDKYGRVISATEPGLVAVTSDYDVLDRVTSTNDDNTGLTVTQSFTGRQKTSTITGDIAGGSQVKTTVYNPLGEQYQVIDELDNTLTYTYNVLGALATVHSSADERVLSTISYDTLGRKYSMQDEDRGYWQYQYNALGQLVEQTDARGVVTTMHYDDLGRKTRQQIIGTNNIASEDMYWVYGTGANKHRLLYERTGSWRRDYYYDNLGRGVATLTNLDGTTNCAANVVFNTINNDLRMRDGDNALTDPIASRCVIQQSFFDEYGRTFQQFDDYRRHNNGIFVEARGVRQHYQNNQVLKQQEAREGTAGRIYNEIVTINSDGLLTSYNKGNQAMSLTYDNAKRLTERSSGNFIQNDEYSYDSMSNLTSRSLAASDLQTFDYDKLNRVTHVNNEQRYHYDNNGNLTEKEGWTLGYTGNNKPLHGVVSRTKGDITETYGYDANGNQIWGKKNGAAWRTFTYSGRNKATNITVDNSTTTFSYDANNKRFKRTDSEGTIFYVGNLELTIKDGESASSTTNHNNSEQETYIKRYLGDAMQTYYANGNAMLRWLYKDHLGSVIAITNDSGKLVKRFSYDVFGQQTEILPTALEREVYYEFSLASVLRLAEISPNTRGYTGHEPVAFDGDNRIVHMNGRMYDAALGRMLQADPVVQAPSNLQNYNAYSYVLNNPLNMTDPSGYFFKKLLRKIASIPILNAIVTVVLAVYCQACLVAYNAASTYAVTGSLKAAFTSAIVSIISPGGASPGAILGTAVIGGLASKVQGGKFGHGFVSAGLGAALGGRIKTGNAVANVVIAAVVGGTISKLTGGKFANGAQTWAFSAAMAQDWSSKESLVEGSPEWEAREEKALMDDITADQAMLANGGDGLIADNNSHWFERFVKEHGFASVSIRGGFILAGGLDVILTTEGISIYGGVGLGMGFSVSGTSGISAGADSSGWNSKTSAGGGFGAGGNATMRVSPQGVNASVGGGTAWGLAVTTTIGYKGKIWDL